MCNEWCNTFVIVNTAATTTVAAECEEEKVPLETQRASDLLHVASASFVVHDSTAAISVTHCKALRRPVRTDRSHNDKNKLDFDLEPSSLFSFDGLHRYELTAYLHHLIRALADMNI